ncbi:MAG: hypothetical protein ACYC0B_07770 [Gemmatimonadaceae bacterium]
MVAAPARPTAPLVGGSLAAWPAVASPEASPGEASQERLAAPRAARPLAWPAAWPEVALPAEPRDPAVLAAEPEQKPEARWEQA